MDKKNPGFPEDGTEGERRKHLSDEEVRELELAGGAEGRMQAGSAGGPGSGDAKDSPGRFSNGQSGRGGR